MALDPNKRRRRPKKCEFCTKKGLVADYKNVDLLKRFMSDKGKIQPARVTGCCAKHQRAVTAEIKKSRNIALLPYTTE